ncbi:MAG: right-handed parallel beta-helix repeat-containing protein [Deltaproteobacteria bacterium]|nr:right-handed parallel beta-helix repeat-containing protein [Deltaproteobacteria bacterium]
MAHRLGLALALLAALGAPGAGATVLEVPTSQFPDIPSALTAAKAGDTVRVGRGTYSTALTLRSDVTLEGEETAATTLTGAIKWASGATLQRFTLSETELSLSGTTSGTLRNNIFRDTKRTALQIGGAHQSQGTLAITHNTFLSNGTGLEVVDSGSTVLVEFNLFANNGKGVTITTPVGTGPAVQNNHFFPDADLPVGVPSTQGDPLFLDTSDSPEDLHVTEESPARERGAYSGPFADPTPGPVEGVTVTPKDDTHVTVSWTGNRAFGVSVTEYALGFKKTSGGKQFPFSDPVPVQDPPTTRYTVDASIAPAVPEQVAATPTDGGLLVSWAKDNLADGYKVHLRTDDSAAPTTTDVGNVTDREIRGLVNGTVYRVSVSAYAVGDRFISVTARAPKSGDAVPESRASDSTRVTLPRVESDPSPESALAPGELQGYPPLEDKGGCFVRTAGPRNLRLARLLGVLLGFLAASALAWRGGPRPLRRLAALALLLGPFATPARAGWVAGIGGGLFYPADRDWADHYGDRSMPEGRLSVGYLPVLPLEAGVDVAFRRDKGEVTTSSSGEALAAPVKQTLSALPLQAYLLLNLRWREGQWLVPFVAGGYTRVYYWSAVDNGAKVRGHVAGYHGRVGLKLLLNGLDPTSARHARDRLGLQRTFLVVEAQRAQLKNGDHVEDALGGTSYFGSLSLEF